MNTPTNDEYGDMEVDSRPEEDDIDTYDKYIGAKVILDEIVNGRGNIATVKRRVTALDGRWNSYRLCSCESSYGY